MTTPFADIDTLHVRAGTIYQNLTKLVTGACIIAFTID